MVQGRWFPGGSDITLPLQLRMSVFGRGEDATDAYAQQAVIFENDVPVAAARLWWQDGAFYIGDIGVLEDKRGRGFGDLLVRLTLYKALTHAASVIRLECPADVESFFAQYGFETDGEASGLKQMSIRRQRAAEPLRRQLRRMRPPQRGMHSQGAAQQLNDRFYAPATTLAGAFFTSCRQTPSAAAGYS